MFDDLIPRTLVFRLNGREIECPMLPVRFFGRYLDVLEQTAGKICADSLTDGRARLREIVLSVWPKKEAEQLYHLDYHGMTQLARDLFFGPDQNIRTKEQSYGSGNFEEPDLELVAGRIMSIFPAYDLDRVMSMTLPQFFAMGCLAMRMQADQSLQVMIPAVAAGLGSPEMVRDLQSIRNRVNRKIADTRNYSNSDYESALARLRGPLKEVRTVKAGMQL